MSFALVTFTISLLIAFPFFLLIGYKDSGKARSIIWYIVHYWAKGWLRFVGMGMNVSGQFPKGKKFVIVANHISYIDAVNLYAAIPDYFRTLGKKEMKTVPVFGFVYKQLAILVDRSSPFSRAKSMRLMWRQIKRECSIAVFPEGTLNETGETLKSFYDGAFRLAIQSQTPILPVLFPDTVNRWHYSGWWKLWPGKNRAVFLEPISVKGMTLNDVAELREVVKKTMKEKLEQL
jgi:1-acyl-sn-glycerol-3-phosphate acyltransferase